MDLFRVLEGKRATWEQKAGDSVTLVQTRVAGEAPGKGFALSLDWIL